MPTIYLKLGNGESAKPLKGKRWIITGGSTSHQLNTATSLLISSGGKQSSRPLWIDATIEQLGALIPVGTIILDLTVNAIHYPIAIEVPRPMIVSSYNGEQLMFSSDASDVCNLQIWEEDEPSGTQTQPTTPTSTVDRGVQWWQ